MKIKNHLLHNVTQYYEQSTTNNVAKGLVVELVPPHVQSAWRSREERVRAAKLVTCCNYFSRKRKRKRKKKKTRTTTTTMLLLMNPYCMHNIMNGNNCVACKF